MSATTTILRAERDHLDTRLLHDGASPDPATGAVVVPIHQSTTFAQPDVGRSVAGFTYSRTGNPTVAALERRLGALEDAPPAVCFGTGLAAITGLLLATTGAEDHVVVGDVVYGGTVRLLRDVLGRFGLRATFVDARDAEAVAAAIEPCTRLVLVETPANPTLVLTDLAAVAEACRSRGVLLAVDNTFLTAALQRPFEHGADVVVYSTTKYLDGHNATTGGAVLARDEALLERVRFTMNAIGAAQTPFEAWLTLQGIKTLGVRLRRQSESALAIARRLEGHPAVARVHHPLLASFPQRELARRQQDAGGAMVAIELAGGADAARTLCRSLRLAHLAENLGAVESLVTHPATMTHVDVPPEDRARFGLDDGLVRLSVGLEDPEDLGADLESALEALVVGTAGEVIR